nr:hypothetical protein [uncultured Aminipila sp.]
MNTQNINFADISSEDVEALNSVQNQIKTKEGKDIVLLAYEK